MYKRVVTQDGVTVMNKELYDNLQDGIDELKSGQFLEVMGSKEIICDSSKKGGMLLNKLFGKSKQVKTNGHQLIPYPYAETTKTSNGITWTDNGDGSVTVSGIATGESYFNLRAMDSDVVGGQYYLSGGTSKVSLYTSDKDDTTEFDNGEGVSLPNGYGFISLYVKNGTTVSTTTIYPMLNKGTEALPWEQFSGGYSSPSPNYSQKIESVGEDGSVNVDIIGENLLPYPYYHTTMKINGITFTDNGDGTITANGTATAKADFDMFTTYANPLTGLPKGAKVTLSGCPKDGSANKYSLEMVDVNWKKPIIDTGNGSTSEVLYEKYIVYIRIQKGTTCNNLVFKPVLNIGNVALPFVPFKKQTLTFNTPNGLRGIPVTDASLANFIDQDGQMWCCDEIDFERGVYIQRIGEFYPYNYTFHDWGEEEEGHDYYIQHENYGSDIIASFPVLCNKLIGSTKIGLGCVHYRITSGYNGYARFGFRFPKEVNTQELIKAYLGEDCVIYYPLKTPIETKMDNSEIAKKFGLKSYDNCTTIVSDEDIGISAEFPTTDGAGIAGLAINIARQVEMRNAILDATVEE